jgi:hypothetical protein
MKRKIREWEREMAVDISMWSQVVQHWLWFSSPVICQFNWFSSCIQLFPSNQILVTVVPPDPPLPSKHQSIYTLKLIAYVLGDIELFLTILGSGVQCHRPPRWFWNQAGGWNASYLLSPSWIHVFGMLALHFNTLLTFFVACRLKHYLIKFLVNFFY